MGEKGTNGRVIDHSSEQVWHLFSKSLSGDATGDKDVVKEGGRRAAEKYWPKNGRDIFYGDRESPGERWREQRRTISNEGQGGDGNVPNIEGWGGEGP